jgi:PST family polysaccharide transporter
VSQRSDLSPQQLDRKFVGGLAWTASAKWLTQGLTWISVLIVARLLSPADFGLVELAGVAVIVGNVLAEFGIGAAVVQMRELNASSIAQLNLMSAAFGLLAFLGGVLLSPAFAAFFGVPPLQSLIAVNSLALFITGLQAVPLGVLRRDLDYKRLSVAEAVQSIIQALATVLAAWSGLAYWALVIGHLSGRAASAILTYAWTRIPFHWPEWKGIRDALLFGYHVSVASLAGTMYSMADVVIIGRRLGDSLLGNYRMALTLAYAPTDKIASLVIRVTGPIFANVREDYALVRRYFLIFTELLTLTILPMTIGMAIVAPELIEVVLGAKWLPSVGPLRFIALFASFRVISFLINQVLAALRFTRLSMRLSLLSFCVMPVAFWFAADWGLTAVAAAWLLLVFLEIGPGFFAMAKEIHLSLPQLLQALLPSLLASATMAAGIFLLQFRGLFEHWIPLWTLAAKVSVGAALYIGFQLAFFRPRLARYLSFAKTMRANQPSA